jgi:hypothetical protein
VADVHDGSELGDRRCPPLRQPLRYYGKVFFWTKMVLMVFAGLNALYFHYTTYKTVAAWIPDRRRSARSSPARCRSCSGSASSSSAGSRLTTG